MEGTSYFAPSGFPECRYLDCSLCTAWIWGWLPQVTAVNRSTYPINVCTVWMCLIFHKWIPWGVNENRLSFPITVPIPLTGKSLCMVSTSSLASRLHTRNVLSLDTDKMNCPNGYTAKAFTQSWWPTNAISKLPSSFHTLIEPSFAAVIKYYNQEDKK